MLGARALPAAAAIQSRLIPPAPCRSPPRRRSQPSVPAPTPCPCWNAGWRDDEPGFRDAGRQRAGRVWRIRPSAPAGDEVGSRRGSTPRRQIAGLSGTPASAAASMCSKAAYRRWYIRSDRPCRRRSSRELSMIQVPGNCNTRNPRTSPLRGGGGKKSPSTKPHGLFRARPRSYLHSSLMDPASGGLPARNSIWAWSGTKVAESKAVSWPE